MRARNEIWTIVLVTLVTVLTWAWAARETLDERQYSLRVTLDTTGTDMTVINKSVDSVRLTVEGSTHALNEFSRLSAELPLEIALSSIDLPQNPTGPMTIDLGTLIADAPLIRDSGVTVTECNPPAAQIEVDRLIEVECEVVARTRRMQLQFEEITFNPPRVTMSMPRRLRQTFLGSITVAADFDAGTFDPQSSNEQTVTLQLRPPDSLSGNPLVKIQPPGTTEATFKIRSQLLETTLDSVVVWLYGPPADADDYSVECTPTHIQNVRIQAATETIRRIDNGELMVVAMLQLSSREKEQGVERKQLTGIVALPRNATDIFQPIFLDASVDGDTTLPEVAITVSERQDEPSTAE